MKYDEVASVFREKGCVLLSSREEVEKAKKLPKFRYTAKCNHEHVVFYNVFKHRGTGVLCPECVIKASSKRGKERIQDDKIMCIKLEKKCIDYFIEGVKDEFECIKAFDGCKADMIFRPVKVKKDKWVGIQVKSTANMKMDYGFHLTKKNYEDLLILCMCWVDKRMWIFPYEDVKHLSKITIGLKTSKYDNYELTKETLKTKLREYYKESVKQTFDTLDTPINIYQQREKLFRQIREDNINFLEYMYTNTEGEVYDFICEGLKVQEKVGSIHRNGSLFSLYKNNGKNSNKSRSFISYKKGDNDIYWFHCQDKRYFYVIPEAVLIDQKKVNTSKKESLYLSIKNDDAWYSEYLFDYDNIDKQKLLKTFKNE
jgi:hypothetical protein